MEDYSQLKLENQLCFPLYSASRKVVGAYEPILKKLGITYTQYLVFLCLWEEDGLSVSELGDKLFLDSGTLTPLLKKLEEKGFLRRIREKKDQRIVKIRLTEKGRELKEKAKDVPMQVGSCLSISKEDAESLYRILYALLEGE